MATHNLEKSLVICFLREFSAATKIPSCGEGITVQERFTSSPPVLFSLRPVGGAEDWRSARTLCQTAAETDFAKILSQVQNLAAQSLVVGLAAALSRGVSGYNSTNQSVPLLPNKPLEKVWIGLRLNKTNTNFEWDNGCSSVYSNYCPGSGTLGCLAIREDGCWEVLSCKERIKFALCEEPPQQCSRFPADSEGYCPPGFDYKCGTNCYYWGGLSKYRREATDSADPALTYEEATSVCQMRNSSLAIIRNWEENHCLRGKVNGHLNFGSESPPWNAQHGGFWFKFSENVSRTNAWNYWLGSFDGAGLPWTNWHPDEDLLGARTDVNHTACGLIGWMGLWRRIPCTEKHGFICQTEMLVYPAPKKESYYTVAMVIVCLAAGCVAAFLLMLVYVCCRKHPGPSMENAPIYVPDDD